VPAAVLPPAAACTVRVCFPVAAVLQGCPFGTVPVQLENSRRRTFFHASQDLLVPGPRPVKAGLPLAVMPC